ncbi:iron uptake system protein EfeO [Amaricoccus solimangrovi]|uniref:Multidrug DMT transporter permease n=1 Tax=Amaricoccus solimangrovi TaxID=2589815 RepID=A0A501WL44_9RHOB|nr:iron uptake system protein EfeO [Amaricoccus solimangrovi]TPE50229.1 multidrug DMT transporter permease [Amaricoccus solimangrovi]
MPETPRKSAGTATRLMLAGAAVLVLLGIGAFWLAARRTAAPPAADEIVVTVNDATCEPATLEVPAGRRTFRIHNASDRPLEWEILDGVMVVAERENIAPGLNATLSQRLAPGTYEITCGLLSNPRGTLTVVATAESEARQAAPETREFIGPLSEYRVYLGRRSGQVLTATAALSERIAAGDVEGAKAAWTAARVPWREIAPVSARWSDLTNGMDPQADYLAKREEDPGFTGFHRIEYGLWSQGTTEGLQPAADKLLADAATLKERLGALDLAPADLAGNAAAFAQRVADQATGSQTPYSHTELAEFSADLDGIAKSALLVDPLVAAASPATSEALHKALGNARSVLDGFMVEGAWPSYDTIDTAGREKIAQAFAAVAGAAGAYNAAIGLE